MLQEGAATARTNSDLSRPAKTSDLRQRPSATILRLVCIQMLSIARPGRAAAKQRFAAELSRIRSRRRLWAPQARRQRRAQPPKARAAHTGPQPRDSPDQHGPLATLTGWMLLAALPPAGPSSQQPGVMSAHAAAGYASGIRPQQV